MNVSSLTPWLWDIHTVWFSVSSGCFLFLNVLLSFFGLCEEAQCIYLCLHLGRKFGAATLKESGALMAPEKVTRGITIGPNNSTLICVHTQDK